MTEFHTYRVFDAGISIEETAALCGVTSRTIRDWDRGARPVPFYAWQILKTLGAGMLPAQHASWKGWRLRGEYLLTPEQLCYTAGEIQAMFLLRQEVQLLKKDLRQLQRYLTNDPYPMLEQKVVEAVRLLQQAVECSVSPGSAPWSASLPTSRAPVRAGF